MISHTFFLKICILYCFHLSITDLQKLHEKKKNDCINPVLRVDNGGLIQSHKLFSFIPYPTNLDCEWLILAPNTFQIMIQFNFINIESDKFCQYDFIEFLNLSNQSTKFCGNDSQKRFISQNNRLVIRFHSDQSISLEGFQLRYLFILSSNVNNGEILSNTSDRSCSDDEWKCNYGDSCIPKMWLCDNIRDCLDNSDELNCVSFKSCHQSQISCASGHCLSKELWCNGKYDCEDHSDESKCDFAKFLPDPFMPSLINHCSLQYIKPKNIDDIIDDNSQIVGGQEAVPGSWPWMVSLKYGILPLCGGSLLSERWVVSAAHCFIMNPNPDYWNADLGRHFLFNGTVQSIQVEKIILNPKFDVGSVDYDIALVKLKKRAILTQSIQTVCLPETLKPPMSGKKCVILGWGNTMQTGNEGVLKQAIVPIVDKVTCNKDYQNIITDQMICSGYQNGGVDSCDGDSGGPLVCKDGNNFFLYGITSWGDNCALPNKPGIYTNVVNFVEWIKQYIYNIDSSTISLQHTKEITSTPSCENAKKIEP